MRSFSDSERERIRRELRETGRALFSQYGLRKTTIAELTDPADIATSTFYQFYDSKEALYLELLEEEGEEIAERLLAASFERYDDPERAIETFILEVMTEVETNPLIHQLVVGDELDRLRDQFSDDELAAEQERDVGYFLPYVEAWYDQGALRGPSPEVIAHVIRSLTFLTLHEEDIPMYEDVKEATAAALARGLVDTDGNGGGNSDRGDESVGDHEPA